MGKTFTFEIEGHAPARGTAFADIEAAIGRISPRGPSFFILQDETGSYVQAAGARARLTVEFRHVTRFGFRHYVLGRRAESNGEASVNYSGGPIRVQSNEILTTRDAVAIFREFFDAGTVSNDYARRETTSMFESR